MACSSTRATVIKQTTAEAESWVRLSASFMYDMSEYTPAKVIYGKEMNLHKVIPLLK